MVIDNDDREYIFNKVKNLEDEMNNGIHTQILPIKSFVQNEMEISNQDLVDELTRFDDLIDKLETLREKVNRTKLDCLAIFKKYHQ